MREIRGFVLPTLPATYSLSRRGRPVGRRRPTQLARLLRLYLNLTLVGCVLSMAGALAFPTHTPGWLAVLLMTPALLLATHPIALAQLGASCLLGEAAFGTTSWTSLFALGLCPFIILATASAVGDWRARRYISVAMTTLLMFFENLMGFAACHASTTIASALH